MTAGDGTPGRPWRPPRRRPARRPARVRRPEAARSGLPDWDALAGAARQEAWADLAGWVTWLHDRYELSSEERLPHCWAEHPGLVEELSALRAWRLEIWNSPHPSGQAARYWHAEMRQTINAALTFYAAGCRVGHRAAEPATPQLRHRWAAASPPGQPGAGAPGDGGYLADSAMTALVQVGRATALSQTVTGYLRHDQSWWQPAPGGWQRVTDQATASLLDQHAHVMAQADQAVCRAAVRRGRT